MCGAGRSGTIGSSNVDDVPANEFWHSHAAAFHDYATNVDTTGWRMFTQFAAVSVLLPDILTRVESVLRYYDFDVDEWHACYPTTGDNVTTTDHDVNTVGKDALPIFIGLPNTYKDWKRRVEAWAVSTNTAPEKQAPRVIQCLRGEAWAAT